MEEGNAVVTANSDYHIDRVDFIPPGRCHFCGRPLPSCVAYIVRDGSGAEYPCGPVCVATRTGVLSKGSRYPDFTKVAEPAVEWAGRGSGQGMGGVSRARSHHILPHRRAGNEEVEYLVLRYDKLRELPGMRIPPLDSLYERYRCGELTEADRRHLAALVRKVRSVRPEYSPENLAAVYAYSFWIRVALVQLPVQRHDFLKKMLLQLIKTLHLTVAQAEGVNRWLAKIEGLPVLDPQAFVQPVSR